MIDLVHVAQRNNETKGGKCEFNALIEQEVKCRNVRGNILFMEAIFVSG